MFQCVHVKTSGFPKQISWTLERCKENPRNIMEKRKKHTHNVIQRICNITLSEWSFFGLVPCRTNQSQINRCYLFTYETIHYYLFRIRSSRQLRNPFFLGNSSLPGNGREMLKFELLFKNNVLKLIITITIIDWADIQTVLPILCTNCSIQPKCVRFRFRGHYAFQMLNPSAQYAERNV